MEVTVTHFRKNVFDLVGRALRGESISVSYKGRRIRLVPDSVADSPTQSEYARFRNITPIDLFTPGQSIDDESWKEDMMKEWEEDWKDL